MELCDLLGTNNSKSHAFNLDPDKVGVAYPGPTVDIDEFGNDFLLVVTCLDHLEFHLIC